MFNCFIFNSFFGMEDKLYNFIQDIIDNLSDDDLRNLHQDYCECNNYTDDMIFSMCDFNDLNNNKTPLEIAELVCGNDFNPNHDWFKYTIYGVESSDNVSDLIYISDLVNWVEIDPYRIRKYLDYDEEEELDELLGLNDDEDWEEDEDEDDNDE